jgi:hypothetical protein
LKKLLIFRDRIESEMAISIIRVIYNNIHKLSKKEQPGDFWNSEYYKAVGLLMLLINDKINRDKIQEILEEIILKTPYIPFAVLVVYECDKEKEGLYYNNVCNSVNIGELRGKLSQRLREYFIEENRDIFDELKEEGEWGFVLYQWGANWGTFEGDNSKIVNDYVFSLIKVDAKKFIKFLLHWKETEFPQETRVFKLDKFGKIYNLLELRDIANKFKDDELLTTEEKAEIRMLLELLDKKLEAENKSHSEGEIP